MTDLRTAAQQALEALNGVLDAYGEPVYELSISGGLYEAVECRDAITALRAALEQPEQEPVGQLQEEAFGRGNVMWFHKPADGTVFYTHPPRREWQSLTDQEITDIFEAEPRYHYPPICATDREFARDIEAALKERNHG